MGPIRSFHDGLAMPGVGEGPVVQQRSFHGWATSISPSTSRAETFGNTTAEPLSSRRVAYSGKLKGSLNKPNSIPSTPPFSSLPHPQDLTIARHGTLPWAVAALIACRKLLLNNGLGRPSGWSVRCSRAWRNMNTGGPIDLTLTAYSASISDHVPHSPCSHLGLGSPAVPCAVQRGSCSTHFERAGTRSMQVLPSSRSAD
jgi:hypothetical protein